MLRVKIIKHMCVPFEGHDYTQADGVFELPDRIAQVYIDGGTCAEADLPIEEEEEEEEKEESGDGEHELLFLLPANRAGVLLPVLEEAGYTTAASVVNADVDDLVVLRGIGEKTAVALQDAAYAFINSEE